MIASRSGAKGEIIEVRPHRPLSFYQLRWLLFIVCLPCALIALAWAYMGAVLILPFAGLEVALVVGLSVVTFRQSRQLQRVTVGGQMVQIDKHTSQGRRRYHLKRDDAFLLVEEPNHQDSPLAISLASCKHHVCVGEFLNASESRKLLDALKKTGLQIKARYRLAEKDF